MNTNIEVKENAIGQLVVTENGQYDNDAQFQATMTLSFVARTMDTSTVVDYTIHNHNTKEVVNKLKVPKDGYYYVSNVVMMTLEALKQENVKDGIYATDGIKFYTYKGDELHTMTFDEMVNDDLWGFGLVYREGKLILSLYNLWQCYFNYCRKTVENCTDRCQACNDQNTINRDLLWIFLNSLQYWAENGDKDAIDKALAFLQSCNSLCHNEYFSKNHNCGCG